MAEGASMYDVCREGGSRNAANFQTNKIVFADKEGGQKIPKLCGRLLCGSPQSGRSGGTQKEPHIAKNSANSKVASRHLLSKARE